jgi:uncharacterized membrane protein (UPF0127 family)
MSRNRRRRRPRAPDQGSGVRGQGSGKVALILAALLSIFSACGGAAKSSTSPTPPPPPAVATPRVVLPSGTVYRVELARTPEEQAQGLMFRESLPERSGMLFLFSDAAPHKFWMKNTMIPLDMIWMDPSGKVIFVSADTPPCKADPCPNYGPESPAASVLEIAGGKAAKEKVTVGSVIRFDGVMKSEADSAPSPQPSPGGRGSS